MTRIPLLCATLAAVLVAACHPFPEPTPAPPGADDCTAFCTLITDMHCPGYTGSPGEDEQFGTTDDVPCVTVCRNALSAGTYTSNRACLDNAKTCEVAEACTFDGASQ